jgi:hypothetical protein
VCAWSKREGIRKSIFEAFSPPLAVKFRLLVTSGKLLTPQVLIIFFCLPSRSERNYAAIDRPS